MAEEIKTVVRSTDEAYPGVTVQTMPWWAMLLVRTARVFLQTFGSTIGVDATGLVNVTPDANGFLERAQAAAIIAGVAAFGTLIWNGVELLNGLDASHPRLRA